MNDHEATRLLGRLADQVEVGPAPVQDLIRAGRSAQRRRRRVTVLGAAAATVMVLVGGFAVEQSLRSADGDGLADPPVAAPPAPLAPDGMRLVGMSRVVVAVPEWWANGDVKCGQPLSNTAYFVSDGNRACLVTPQNPVTFVGIASTSSSAGRHALVFARKTETVNGIPVVRGPIRCELSLPGICHQTVAVPGEDVVFTITSPEAATIDSIRESLRLLPPGYTTVPYDPNGPTQDTAALMEATGLDVQIVKEHREGSSAGTLLGSQPTLGSVVATGATITLTVSSGAKTTDEVSDAITVTPATPAPGQLVRLTFPEANERGAMFSLADRDEQGWSIAYCLTSSRLETGTPTWRKAGDNDVCGGDSIGFYGSGPDQVLIPDIVPDGNYRLCTANALVETCSLLTIAK